jgi:hypothetical protein
MVWWERRLEAANKQTAVSPRESGIASGRNPAPGGRARNGVGKPSRAA